MKIVSHIRKQLKVMERTVILSEPVYTIQYYNVNNAIEYFRSSVT